MIWPRCSPRRRLCPRTHSSQCQCPTWPDMPRFQLAPAADVPPNTMRAFPVAGRRVLVVNLDGELRALDDQCPHLAVPLNRGELQDGCVVCPGHGSVFDVRSGQVRRWVGKRVTWLTRLT